MKKLLTAALVCLLLVGLGATALYVKRNEFYDWAMQFEASQSRLTAQQLTVGKLAFAYYEGPARKDQETLVLVHGFAAQKENWLRFARDLTNDYHVIAVDLPGHGQSIRSQELTYTIQDQVAYLGAFFKALGVTKMHLVGNSMGGAIVAMYASAHPSQVKSLTLLDPAGIFDHESEFADALKDGKNPLIVRDKASMAYLMDFAMSKKPWVPWPVTDVLADRAAANQHMHEKVFNDMIGSYDEVFRQRLRNIQAPTLIVWGEEDRVIHYKNAAIYQSHILGSKLALLPGIGHAPMIEIPGASAEMVQTFISGL